MKGNLEKSLTILKEGKNILYPTDTVWGIGCDATNENAVAKIFKIKNRRESKSLIILVDSLKMLQDVIPKIPKEAVNYISKSSKPTSIIYKNPIGIAKNCIAIDNTVAIRIVNDVFCKELIKQFGKPIVSTSANTSGSPTPTRFDEIEKTIVKQVDFVVKLKMKDLMNKPSRIISFAKEKAQIIRE
jgi:L-threonylcarbamoyladenylate synthase